MTEKEVKQLIKKRDSFKGRLTTFCEYIEGLEDSLSPSQLSELQLRIGKIEHLYDLYDEVQLKLECLDNDTGTLMLERKEFESMYYKFLSKGQELFTRNVKLHRSELTETTKGSFRGNLRPVKLPNISLPVYKGSYENWLEYRDKFASLIHSNDDIDDINKFHYLRASLEGSAAVVIQSIAFSAMNYSVAWNLLCERFDNKRLLIQNHVAALFNMEPISRESSANLKRIIDATNKNLQTLNSLDEPTKFWDTLLIYIISHKLDSKTYREWEEQKSSLNKNLPIKLELFMEFLRNRADLLETLELQSNQFNKTNSKHRAMVSIAGEQSIKTHTGSKLCPKCDGEHNLSSCSQFLGLSNTQRLELVPQYKVCYNCLNLGHFANRCKAKGCNVCKRKHNTLIHVTDLKTRLRVKPLSTSSGDEVVVAPVHDRPTGNITLSALVTTYLQNKSQVLLPTSLLKVYDSNNCQHLARAILDTGSTSCVMTERLCQLLNLSRVQVNESLLGINNSKSHIGEMCCVAATSLCENYSTNLFCFIIPTITDEVPGVDIALSDLNIPSDIYLADPNFYSSAGVDLIIGADVFWDLLGSRKIELGDGKPILYESRLGWLISGPMLNGDYTSSSFPTLFNSVKPDSVNNHVSTVGTVDDDMQNFLPQFWQVEEINHQSSVYSEEEKMCEEHFINNTVRLKDGRFSVKIPLKQSSNILGDSLQRAKHCLFALERRFRNQPKFKEQYCQFMREYHSLGHMSECQFDSDQLFYYIPHHGIVRDKIRVVFNSSSSTTSGISCNNLQMVGPVVQDDLMSILLRFRTYKYVLSADVQKMYRQILVHADDRHLQRIVWRDDPSQPLKAYELNTVTYGTASAPFLATRCLKQIALECKDEHIANIILHDFYVDDLLTGGDTILEVLNIKNKVSSELASACMPLAKWKCNEQSITSKDIRTPVDLNIGATVASKTLGLCWDTKSDELSYCINPAIESNLSKRGILSVISQIFDPLGLLSPCVITMKMLMQRLWLHKLSWDEHLPADIKDMWSSVVKYLPVLNNLRIPRLILCDLYKIIDLHVFVDASQLAYGACLYARSSSEGCSNVLVRLLSAKSRVAPVKPTTIPRLELCAALVGVRLYEKVISSLRVSVRDTVFWTDSTIVLGWLKMLPSKLQPFVRNRVAEILSKRRPVGDVPGDMCRLTSTLPILYPAVSMPAVFSRQICGG